MRIKVSDPGDRRVVDERWRSLTKSERKGLRIGKHGFRRLFLSELRRIRRLDRL